MVTAKEHERPKPIHGNIQPGIKVMWPHAGWNGTVVEVDLSERWVRVWWGSGLQLDIISEEWIARGWSLWRDGLWLIHGDVGLSSKAIQQSPVAKSKPQGPVAKSTLTEIEHPKRFSDFPVIASRCMKCWDLTYVEWPNGRAETTQCKCESLKAVEPIRLALEKLTPKEKGTLTDEDLSAIKKVCLGIDSDCRDVMLHSEWLRAFVNKHGKQFIQRHIKKALSEEQQ